MKTTNHEVRKRIASLFLLFAAAIMLLSGRFFWIQLVKGHDLSEQALQNRMRDVPVKAKRGVLYDRNGHELAISVSTDSVYAVPAEVKKSKVAKDTAHELAQVLDLDEAEVYKKITRKTSFVWIKRQVAFDKSKQLKKLDLAGVGFAEESRRFYPKGKLACHVLGISGIDNVGLDGIDLYYNNIIGGKDGRIVVEYDAVGREIPEATHRYIPPKDGSNLVLTIDETIQYIVERELDKLVEAKNPKSASVIVMDPRNGEILAMAARPNFDPNHYSDYPTKNRRNIGVSDAYEPGSTMKITTASAALEEGSVHVNDDFFCPGYIKVGKERIQCAQGRKHGAQIFRKVVENSCNVGFVTLGLNLGMDSYYRYLNAYGFGQKTGIDIPGEATGILVPQSRCKQIDLATMSMGQANAVTAIQLVAMAGAVANDGILTKPHLLKEIRDANGKVVQKIGATKVRQVISKETANELAGVLEGVVSEGSGSKARVQGYKVAGKTGTAQKIAPGGGYLPNEYVASFLGFAPVDDPRLVCMVVIDDPKGYPYFGGQVAAPVFQVVVQDSLRYLEVPLKGEPAEINKSTQETKNLTKVPDLLNLSPKEALQALNKAGLNGQIQGEGDVVWSQVPKAYTEVQKGTTIRLNLSAGLGKSGTGKVTVPDLRGKSMKDAARALAKIGLHLRADGSGLAVKQQPAPGTQAAVGSMVKVQFRPLD
ncbi:MAG: stage V sporulation protein D [Ignavibacteriales bacterium]